jgi:hypothetical protein
VLHVRVLDDDFGFDDLLGSCNINLELKEGKPMEIEKVIEHKKTGAWFSEKAKNISQSVLHLRVEASFASVQVVEQLKDAASLLGRGNLE